MKKYILIYTDFGDSCDYKANFIGTYETQEQAKKEMRDDCTNYIECMSGSGYDYKITDERDDYILVGDMDGGCAWQILEIKQ